uniref:Uncharacterized protein n=1 Tax=Nelumbo nucifera TaxID=4432 RepID=A0A822YYF9_NELNU|nr:TPA_asm: hypothetical protein HUJ06_008343 [Nelumbo nucifera]
MPYKPSPHSLVHKQDTILGKPFEDIKAHYMLGKELGKGQFGLMDENTEDLKCLWVDFKGISVSL